MRDVSIPGIPKEVVSIAVNRGVTDLKEFFNPKLKNSTPDPFVLKDMDKAVARCKEALLKGQKICVFGDYDVDGATATSQLLRFFSSMGNSSDFYIPSRSEGYGPNVPAIEKIADDGVNLIIFVDCGVLAFEPLAAANARGMDVIVLDHHPSADELPDGIIVNPNRKDETGDLSYLCAAGLVFLFVGGMKRSLREAGYYENHAEFNMLEILGIAALGTVADVVPLIGFNRALVKAGIPLMARNPGLMGLSKAWNIPPEDFTEHTCGFRFGPCINAGGRIDDTSRGTNLLVCEDQEEADRQALELFEINKERQAMQQAMEASAHDQARDQKDGNVTVIYGEDWHHGIVGIVASRIKDNFDKPAVVIGTEGKGSARSVPGFNIGAAFVKAAEMGILEKGGGHSVAAGLTIDPKRIEEFKSFLNEESAGFERLPLDADIEVPCGTITEAVIDSFQMLAPFGMSNTSPRVILTGGRMTGVKPLKNAHVKGRLVGVDGDVDVIMFYAVGTPLGDALMTSNGKEVDLYGKLSINEYMGKKSIQIIPEDIRFPGKIPESAFEESGETTAA